MVNRKEMILIEALGLANDSGLGKVSRMMVKALADIFSDEPVTVLIRKGYHPPLPKNWQVIECHAKPMRWWISVIFPFYLAKFRPKKVICLGQTLPPIKPNAEYLLLVCDAGPLESVDFQTSKHHERNRKNLPTQIARANRILTISAFSKSRICTLARYPESNIHTFFPIGPAFELPSPKNKKLQPVTKSILSGPFLMSLGNIEPKKNYPNLLKAYRHTLDVIPEAPKLVICGHHAWGMEEVRQVISALSLKDQVIITNHLPTADIGALLSKCTLYISSTLYEGWGFPLFEALTYHRPALYHAATAQHEYAEGLAVQVNCGDPMALSESIQHMLTHTKKRAQLSATIKQKMPKLLQYDLKKRLVDILNHQKI